MMNTIIFLQYLYFVLLKVVLNPVTITIYFVTL